MHCGFSIDQPAFFFVAIPSFAKALRLIERNTSHIGAFEFTNVSVIASKSHFQDFSCGPRFYFALQAKHIP
jgi:hypothetical protein